MRIAAPRGGREQGTLGLRSGFTYSPQRGSNSFSTLTTRQANLLDGAKRTVTGRLIPYAIFTDPQLGRVGLSEAEARKRGLEIKVARLPMAHVARAIETNETRGFMKAVVDTKTGQILGAAILGLEGREVMSVLQVAMMGKIPYTEIRDAVFAHPTLAEFLNNLFMSM